MHLRHFAASQGRSFETLLWQASKQRASHRTGAKAPQNTCRAHDPRKGPYHLRQAASNCYAQLVAPTPTTADTRSRTCGPTPPKKKGHHAVLDLSRSASGRSTTDTLPSRADRAWPPFTPFATSKPWGRAHGLAGLVRTRAAGPIRTPLLPSPSGSRRLLRPQRPRCGHARCPQLLRSGLRHLCPTGTHLSDAFLDRSPLCGSHTARHCL